MGVDGRHQGRGWGRIFLNGLIPGRDEMVLVQHDAVHCFEQVLRLREINSFCVYAREHRVVSLAGPLACAKLVDRYPPQLLMLL